MRENYIASGALPALAGCPAGSVALAADDVQKNERTAQAVFAHLCGREASKLPSARKVPHADNKTFQDFMI